MGIQGVKVKFILFVILNSILLVSSCSKRVYTDRRAPATRPPVVKSGEAIGATRDGRTPAADMHNREFLHYRELFLEEIRNNIKGSSEIRKFDMFRETGLEKAVDTGRAGATEIIETSKTYMGVPHCMGGRSRTCIDCSGLLTSVFATHGIHLPHNSEEQARYGIIIHRIEHLRKGDLVFFTRSYNSGRFITHSGIYTGDNQFIHTSSSRGVTITSLYDPWWNEKFVFGTRIFNE